MESVHWKQPSSQCDLQITSGEQKVLKPSKFGQFSYKKKLKHVSLLCDILALQMQGKLSVAMHYFPNLTKVMMLMRMKMMTRWGLVSMYFVLGSVLTALCVWAPIPLPRPFVQHMMDSEPWGQSM